MLKAPPAVSAPPAPKPLRKATYVTIDKLVRTQYNFDSDKLNEEWKKNKATKIGDEAEVKTGTADPPTLISAVSSTANAVANLDIDTPANAWVNSPLGVLPAPMGQQQQQMPHASSQVIPPFFKTHQHTNRLLPPKDGFNLCVLVGKVDIVVDKLRVDGSRVLVAEVQIGDSTGSVSLRARDEQIAMLQQVSSQKGAVVLRNCTVELHQGKYLRLAVSKWGKMGIYPDGIESTPIPPSEMNEERNFSLVDLNAVTTAKKDESNCNVVSSSIPLFDTQQQQHQYPKQHHYVGNWEHPSPSRSSGPRSYQRRSTNRYQRKQQPSMYSPQQQYYPQNRHQGNPPPFPYYQPYAGDASSVYSYQSHSTENSSLPSQIHRPYHTYQPDYKQQQLMYQQYELQQRHAQQMQMLQETQRRLMAVEAQRLNPEGDDYSVPSTIAMSSVGGSFGNVFRGGHPPPPMGYAYGFDGDSSPMRNMFREQMQEGQQQTLLTEPSSNTATIVSPPVSPQRFGHAAGPPQPPPAYPGDPLLYFDQSSIPLTGMQEQIDSEHNEEGYDDNRS